MYTPIALQHALDKLQLVGPGHLQWCAHRPPTQFVAPVAVRLPQRQWYRPTGSGCGHHHGPCVPTITARAAGGTCRQQLRPPPTLACGAHTLILTDPQAASHRTFANTHVRVRAGPQGDDAGSCLERKARHLDFQSPAYPPPLHVRPAMHATELSGPIVRIYPFITESCRSRPTSPGDQPGARRARSRTASALGHLAFDRLFGRTRRRKRGWAPATSRGPSAFLWLISLCRSPGVVPSVGPAMRARRRLL